MNFLPKLKKKLVNLAARLFLSQTESSLAPAPSEEGGGPTALSPLCLRAAEEGAVLLKNDGTLPLRGRFALFGRVQTDTFYAGYGSGGDVRAPYRVSILDALEGCEALDKEVAALYRAFQAEHPADHGGWGNWPFRFPEMPLTDETVSRAAERSETAVVVIGRAAGEDRENELTRGSFYLAEEEERMLLLVSSRFKRVAVVLNIGNTIDLSFLASESVNAALLVYQGGMEAGNAVKRLLLGEVSPCGKLPAAVARRYEDYPSAAYFGNAAFNVYHEDVYVGYRYFETFAPEKTLFPFGYGLGYTTFKIDAVYRGGTVEYCVKNVGERAGREVVQVYLKKPDGDRPDLGNPARVLVGFRKTAPLPPNGEERGRIAIPKRALATYDSERSALVLLAGKYEFFVGGDVRSATPVGSFETEEVVLEQLSEQAAPAEEFKVLSKSGETSVPRKKKDLKADILSHLPAAVAQTGDRGIALADVKAGRHTMEEFVAQLSAKELEAISRGDYVMDSPLGASGNAGVYGGVLPSLRKKGVPPLATTDGPSGIRLKHTASLLPIATLLAATFDEELIASLYAAVGEEMRALGSDVLLAPAMNLHRNPLCGRNFEYYSEDPFLAGKIAAAAVRGVQSAGAFACPKHFACNNQEFNRTANDSRLSERALREVYLYSFEICVKEGMPRTVMTSYNKVNGVWSHYHYELVRGILRGEWGYRGCVITDWWMRSSKSPEFPKLRDNAYRVRAGVNILMPGGGYLGRRKPDGTLLKTLGKKGGITLGELQRNAAEILTAVMESSALGRMEENGNVV